jgi:predicted NAD/FAD-binding protein
MLRFPAHTLIRFMYNHGLLGLQTHHQWRTVKGGSRQYRDKLIAPFRDRIRCDAPVTSVRRDENGVWVADATGEERCFDKVVMATHADTTLNLLRNPTGKENALLGSFAYGKNKITLHTDKSVMPKNPLAWASWNYRIDEIDGGAHQASTHYWMNSLQNLPMEETCIVSVNEPDIVNRDKVYREFIFDHPMFTKQSVDAQFELPLLNENRKLYFCGSYFRYGFHEDGILSGYAAAERLLTHSAAHAKLAI